MFYRTTRYNLEAVVSNFYKVLGVQRSASPKEIKKAYLTLCKQYHPDNKTDGNEELFKQVNEAYKTLSDPTKRAEYDFEFQNQLPQDEILKQNDSSFPMYDSEQILQTGVK